LLHRFEVLELASKASVDLHETDMARSMFFYKQCLRCKKTIVTYLVRDRCQGLRPESSLPALL